MHKFQTTVSKNHNLPPFLERNKELCIRIQIFCKENLAELGCEMLCEYLHNTVLLKLVSEETQIQKDCEG
jgi:hypothetical protein